MKATFYLALLCLCVCRTPLFSQELYAGVWRSGADGHYLWSGVEWDNFNNKWKDLSKQNLRLIDIETYTRGGKGPNTHLHLFFAHRDPTDKRWYLFEPYGMYATPECYPAAVDGAIHTACARYPVGWKGGSRGMRIEGREG